MMPSTTLPQLMDRLYDGTQMVLPNARAAHELRAAFDAEQRRRGRAAWEPPQVLSWSQWTSALWSSLVVDGAEMRLLLNSAQEHNLWCEVLKEDRENGSLGSVDSLAEMVMSAWRLAADYGATQRLREFAVTHDCRVFAGWTEDFLRRCAEREYLSGPLLDEALLRHVQRGSFAASRMLELVGFEKRVPVQDALLQALRDRGTVIEETRLQVEDEARQPPSYVVAANEKDECGLAAQWIREFLMKSSVEGRSARVAVLVPRLQQERAALEEEFRVTLAPELQWVGSDLSSTPWEISGGVSLASVAMIADALAVARWTEGPLEVARVSSLLLSPYVGENGMNETAREVNARFDAVRLRRLLLLRPEIDLDSLLSLADSATQQRSSMVHEGLDGMGWIRNLHRSAHRLQDRANTRSFAAWMEFVRRLMNAANWPGTRPLNATEFETNRAWESLLDSVSTLDFSGRRVSFAEALQALEVQAQKTIFTPPTTNAPVQVMSVAEAEGCVFDAVLLLRCTDGNWPQSERTNPLLPWAMQRTLKMPGTDSSLSNAWSRTSMEGLLQRATSVLFTRAAEDESGKLRASPLMEELKITPIGADVIAGPSCSVETVALEEFYDTEPLPPLPTGTVPGGSNVIKLQAACGFLAFAQIRLHATEVKLGDIGLDALAAGSLLHSTMQSFWKTVSCQETLRQLAFLERENLLKSSIDWAFKGEVNPRNDWDHAYVALQKERLRSVLQRWLDEELRRGPFSVLDTEQEQLLTVGPLVINVRMDRIDRVNDGIFLVDYKTAYASDPKHWEGPRPDDPQLPLYALLAEADELKGLAFAKVRTGRDMQWLGYQAEEGILPKAKVLDLGALLAEWRDTLAQLAEDFAAGRAEVNPKDYMLNCTRCAQRLLCRVDRDALQTEAIGAQEETEFVDG